MTHLLAPAVTELSPAPLAVTATLTIADGPAGADPSVPHGQARGFYDAMIRPQTTELWVAHLMLGTDTSQPALNFQNTVFPTLTVMQGGAQAARLTVSAALGDGGAFGDIVSGPHAIDFTPDGHYAIIADSGSEDVLVIDAALQKEAALLRPLPGHQPEGVVVAPDGTIYVQERNTSDVAVLSLSQTADGPVLTTSGAVIKLLAVDPMPAELRLGQHMFYSANSDELPVSSNHWVSCASCHIEGRSDAVTWRFGQGPRDTPSNAGGTLHTGFLFRLAARNRVQDYWKTINVEQGGHFSLSIPELSKDLDALERYVDLAISYPVPPRTDPGQVAKGQVLFQTLDCASCHAGPYFTDSGAQNPTLDLGGFIQLHDVGTCVMSGPWTDQATPDEEGHPRDACSFDTPSLRGIADSAPYLHDGSAATLADVLKSPMAAAAWTLSDDDSDSSFFLRSRRPGGLRGGARLTPI